MYNLERKCTIRKLNVIAKECSGRETAIVTEINTVKGGILFFSGIKERVPFGQHITQLNFQTVKGLKSFLLLKRNCKCKLLLMWFRLQGQSPTDSQTEWCHSHDTGFRGMKDTGVEFMDSSVVSESHWGQAACAVGVLAWRKVIAWIHPSKWSLSGFSGDPKMLQVSLVTRHLPRRGAQRKWTQCKREAWGRAVLILNVELQDLVFALLGFGLALVQCFSMVPPFFPFGMVLSILFYYVLEVCDLLFVFPKNYKITLSLNRLLTFKQCWDCDTVLRLWRLRVGISGLNENCLL